MENLPIEIAVEIAARLAESSDFAVAEVGSLRATCKKMRQVYRMPEVGRHLAVHPLLPIGSWDLYYDNGFRQNLIINLIKGRQPGGVLLRGDARGLGGGAGQSPA